MYACLHQVPRAWANRAKASDGLVCILITRASNPKNSRVFQINNVPYNTLQISISFSTTMRNSITKGYKGGCQWNWHFSNGFLSGKQISIALLEVKVKQNLLYNTLESFRIASCCCFLWPGCTGGWSPVWKSCGVASPWPEETRHVTSKSLPNSHYLKLPSIDKKVRLSFLPSWIDEGEPDERHHLLLLQPTQALTVPSFGPNLSRFQSMTRLWKLVGFLSIPTVRSIATKLTFYIHKQQWLVNLKI